MRIDPITADTQPGHLGEVTFPGFSGVRGEIDERRDAISTYGRLAPGLGEITGDNGDPEDRPFWLTTFAEILEKKGEITIKLIR